MKFPDLWDTKNREKYLSKKTVAQDNIYMVRQFVYIHEVAGISLFSGKKIQDAAVQFSLSKTISNPNLQNNSFSILRTRPIGPSLHFMD